MENIFNFAVPCKGITGRRQKCQVHAGRSKKICKEILGQVSLVFQKNAVPLSPSFMQTKGSQKRPNRISETSSKSYPIKQEQYLILLFYSKFRDLK
jgi:hypothetical protein